MRNQSGPDKAKRETFADHSGWTASATKGRAHERAIRRTGGFHRSGSSRVMTSRAAAPASGGDGRESPPGVQSGGQRLLHPHNTVGAQTDGIDHGDDFLKSFQQAARDPPDPARCQNGNEVIPIANQRRRAILKKQSVANQRTAQAGEKGHRKKADDIVPSTERHERAGERKKKTARRRLAADGNRT